MCVHVCVQAHRKYRSHEEMMMDEKKEQEAEEQDKERALANWVTSLPAAALVLVCAHIKPPFPDPSQPCQAGATASRRCLGAAVCRR